MGDYKLYLKKGSTAISERTAQRYRVVRNTNIGSSSDQHEVSTYQYIYYLFILMYLLRLTHKLNILFQILKILLYLFRFIILSKQTLPYNYTCK